MRTIVIILLFLTGTSAALAQSNLKEGSNNFALYLQRKDAKQLEAARKFSDEAYKTKRDSAGFRNNLLRALVYSTLAVVDSNRTQKYSSDPINTALAALKRVERSKNRQESEPEISYIRRSLASAYLIKANKAMTGANYEEALTQYLKVDSIGGQAFNVKHNLAVLSAKTGKTDDAIKRYQAFIGNRETSAPAYILELAGLYEKKKDPQSVLNTLLTGREQFPGNKEILFKLINTYVANESYEAIVPLVDEAIAHEPENVQLNYIAGYANEAEGNNAVAKKYYERVIKLDANNFEGNFELGLLYLREYVANPNDRSTHSKAQEYLLKANQVKPSEINTLKSLAVLYDHAGDIIQLERVNNILNQLTIN